MSVRNVTSSAGFNQRAGGDPFSEIPASSAANHLAGTNRKARRAAQRAMQQAGLSQQTPPVPALVATTAGQSIPFHPLPSNSGQSLLPATGNKHFQPLTSSSNVSYLISPWGEAMWQELEQETQKAFEKVILSMREKMKMRTSSNEIIPFRDEHYPLETAWKLENRSNDVSLFLDANKIGWDFVERRVVCCGKPGLEGLTVIGKADYLWKEPETKAFTEFSISIEGISDSRTWRLSNGKDYYWEAFLNGCRIFDLSTDKESSPSTSYYPDSKNRVINMPGRVVEFIGSGDDLYTYRVTEKVTNETKTIYRYHYTKWNPGDVISVSELTALVDKLDSVVPRCSTPSYASRSPSPAFIHGHGESGRSGTLILALFLKEMLEWRMALEDINKVIKPIIIACRLRAGKSFLGNPKQLKLLYDYVSDLFSRQCIKQKGKKEWRSFLPPPAETIFVLRKPTVTSTIIAGEERKLAISNRRVKEVNPSTKR